jgi:sigma-B regulation protein RsbU (phosphoserine phosphatase)
MEASLSLFDNIAGSAEERMAFIIATMREMSLQTDPAEMRRQYAARMRQVLPTDAVVSLSRRDLRWPKYRVTRSSRWTEEINPWKQPHLLPLHEGGLIAELIYSDEPRLFDDLDIDPDDPAAEYLNGYRSMLAIPTYDHGEALNMILLLRREPHAFSREQFPEVVWMSNLFGRATAHLLTSERLKQAYESVDYEMKVVAEIQRSLLPAQMPVIPTLAVAASYQTSHRAGGDYYDFFPLPEGKWGILIADVSGHGTPAAVLMAVTHSLAHTYPGQPTPPNEMLDYLNGKLAALYTTQSDTFVTAFYAIYNPADRSLTYSSAGHNPPRLKRCQDGTLIALTGARGLPLGIDPDIKYQQQTHVLIPGDELVLYTDGITEADNGRGELFGLERLDKVLENCAIGASDLLKAVLASVEEFTAGTPAHDDRTLLVAKVS